LAFREDLDADELRANAAVIQKTANAALVDLRAVLGVLRDVDGVPADHPQPTYADLESLVDEARRSGIRVRFEDAVGEPVPDAVGRAAYRIVQEGITNVGKHAPDALLTIRVSGSRAEGLRIELRNPIGSTMAAPPGAGLGLVGLSERAELRGGRLTHGRDQSTFWLEGWLPWTA